MIIDSAEYMRQWIPELRGMVEYMKNSPFKESYAPVISTAEYQLKFYSALSPVCAFCMHRSGAMSPDGKPSDFAACKINGPFPDGYNLATNGCVNWVFDDIPF